jgi:hypothetical protein
MPDTTDPGQPPSVPPEPVPPRRAFLRGALGAGAAAAVRLLALASAGP